MIQKHITLLAHCGGCLQQIFKGYTFIKLKNIAVMPEANKAILSLFPQDLKCKDCEHQQIEKSYRYSHEHKFITKTSESEKQLERLKAQIAATYDGNSNISLSERLEIREVLQFQAQQVNTILNINPN